MPQKMNLRSRNRNRYRRNSRNRRISLRTILRPRLRPERLKRQQTLNRKGTFSRVMSPIFLKPTEYASNNGIRELHRPKVLLRKMSLILISSCLKNLTADSSIIGSSANTARAFTARGSGSRITSSPDTNPFSEAPNEKSLSPWG